MEGTTGLPSQLLPELQWACIQDSRGKAHLLSCSDSPVSPAFHILHLLCAPLPRPHLPSSSYHFLCMSEHFVLESRMFFEGAMCTSLPPIGLHTCVVRGRPRDLQHTHTLHCITPGPCSLHPKFPVPAGHWHSALYLLVLTNVSDKQISVLGKLPETPYSQTGCTWKPSMAAGDCNSRLFLKCQ